MKKIPLFVLALALILIPAVPAQTAHSITLTWTPGSSDVTFNVYRATVSGGPYVKINASPVTPATYVDTTGSGGTKYFYVVTGVDSIGDESVNSNEASATFLANPGQPSGLAAVSK